MKLKRIIVFIVVAALVVALAACAAPNAQGGERLSLNILNWGDYIDEEVLYEFMDEYPNIDVNYVTTASNEEMLVQVTMENSIYDICVPSDYAISKLISMDMLNEIDFSKLENYKNIDPRFAGREYDPEAKYSIPYLWGTVGILYNTTMVTGPVTGWADLWDAQYAKKIFMYDSVRDSMMVAFKRLGYSSNSVDPAQIEDAMNLLIEQKPLVLAYGVDDLRDKMVSGSGAMAVVYSGDAIEAIANNEDLAYVVPSEGSNVWFDACVHLKNSKNTEAAYIFLDYLMRPDVAKRNTEYIGYSTPNSAALELLDDELKADTVYNPTDEELARCEAFVDIGDAIALYDEAWITLKNHS